MALKHCGSWWRRLNSGWRDLLLWRRPAGDAHGAVPCPGSRRRPSGRVGSSCSRSGLWRSRGQKQGGERLWSSIWDSTLFSPSHSHPFQQDGAQRTSGTGWGPVLLHFWSFSRWLLQFDDFSYLFQLDGAHMLSYRHDLGSVNPQL